jgi:hypothetical protein
VTQDDVITNAELADIYAAGDAIIFPNDPTNLSFRITSIRMDVDGEVFVDWSDARGMVPLSTNSLPDLPDGLLAPMNSIIMVEARYPFQGPFAKTAAPLGDPERHRLSASAALGLGASVQYLNRAAFQRDERLKHWMVGRQRAVIH